MAGEQEIVRLRVMGAPTAVDQLVGDLEAAAVPWCDVRSISPPYANRGDAREVRRYVTVLVPVRSQRGEDDGASPSFDRQRDPLRGRR
jgi:hypothetical protein